MLRFHGLADFRISHDATKVLCVPVPEVPDETLRHLFLDQVLPRCLAHTGCLIVHASAVMVGSDLLLFMGEPRAGKSTLAASFHQAGYVAVSDDAVLLRTGLSQARAIPSYGGLRLWEDSLRILPAQKQPTRPMAHYSAKRRVPLDGPVVREATNAVPILAAIVLSPVVSAGPRAPSMARLSLRHAYMEMEKQSFLLDPSDTQRIRLHVRLLTRVVRRLAIFRLTMPRDYGSLPTVRAAILQRVLQPAT